MSRIGLKPIELPPGVEITLEGREVTVTGPKGQLRHTLPASITVSREDSRLIVSRASDQRQHRALHGLTRSLLANMVTGVTQGFQKTLELQGVGYRAQPSGEGLVLSLGFSHRVEFPATPGITLSVEGNRITVSGIDKQLVGQVAANLRALRPPNRYTGKGIRYLGELVRRKPGKAARKVR